MTNDAAARAEGTSRPRPTALELAGLFVFAVAIHVPYLLRRPFFAGDDFGWLADADNVLRGFTGFFSLPAWGVWRLGQRAFWIGEYAAFGLNPTPYHVLGALLHGVAAVLVARVLARASGSKSPAAVRPLLAGALFAVAAGPSLTVRYASVTAVIIAAIAVLVALDQHLRDRPVAAAAAILLGATFYEQALCAPAAMLLANAALGRRPLWRGVLLPGAASVLFFAVNVWTLRGTTKVYAYNAGGGRALAQAVTAPFAVVGRVPPLAIAAGALALLLVVGAMWRPARGILPGLVFAWIAVVPMLGRNVGWSEWYFYLSAAGVAAALAFALDPLASRGRAGLALTIVLAAGIGAWSLWEQAGRARYFAGVADGYETITRSVPPSRDAAAAVFVNVHSGLAWTAWQFGGAVRRFELWDAPDGKTRCYAGRELEPLRSRMLSEAPGAVLRSRYPDDLPPGMRDAHAPARVELFPWP